MSAGRLQLYERPGGSASNKGADRAKKPSWRDRTARLLVNLTDGRQLRLREFGSKQAAWVKLLPADELPEDRALVDLGPDAWPDPPPLPELLDGPRPLHAALRDQRAIAGIGRSWVDEILWRASISPYRRVSDLGAAEAEHLREVIVEVLGGAIEHYERVVDLPIPDKLPMPLQVHRHQGQPCPRCGVPIAGVHFEDYVIAYCPACQTGGRVLKDRRLSRLLK
jgi:formamidopyrimidine-DNA glycosylase